MGKSTSVKKSKGSDPLTKVKNAGVSKATESPKAKSKALAKEVAAKGVNGKEKKKSKKPVESESESSESESEEEDESSESEDDSDDSDSSSEEEKPKKKVAAKKAAPAAAKKDESDSDSDSSDADSDDSDSSEEEEKPKAKANGTKAAAAKKDESDSDSDSSEDSSDSDSDEEEEKPKAKDSSDSDSSDSSDSDEEEKPAVKEAEEPAKKRKALDDPVIPAKKARTDESEPSSTLFVGSLAWAVNDDTLYGAFSDCADLVSARVITDREGGRSRGFGYVDFANHEAAQAAMDAKQGSDLEGRAINIDFSGGRPAPSDNPRDRASNRAQRHGDSVSPESDTLFVGNLSFDIDQDSVREFFASTGEVTGVRLPTDPYVHLQSSCSVS